VPEQPPDFRTIIEAMSDANVRCVLIGGLAMSVHGSSHVTQDIDFGYSRDRANLAALVRALGGVNPRARGLPPDLPFVWDQRTLRAMTNMTQDTDASTVDLLADIICIPCLLRQFHARYPEAQPTLLIGDSAQVLTWLRYYQAPLGVLGEMHPDVDGQERVRSRFATGELRLVAAPQNLLCTLPGTGYALPSRAAILFGVP